MSPCSCRKGAWNPECPKHGRTWRDFTAAAYFVAVVLAVVLTGQGAA